MIISFLASHGGSSARAIIQAIRDGRIKAEVGIVITNNRNSAIYHWCLDNDVMVRHISSKTHRGEDNADEAIETVLSNENSDLVVCSGYMKKIGHLTLQKFSGKILNIHPALLPNFGGKAMYGDYVHQAVLNSQQKESGATVHYVTANYDEGPIILQQRVSVDPKESLESLRSKVQALEPELYINAIQKVIHNLSNLSTNNSTNY